MTREFAPARLDVISFAEAAAVIAGNDPIRNYGRLCAELVDPAENLMVRWEAAGQTRRGSDGSVVPWMHLTADVPGPFICQRCLSPVDVLLHVGRWFRFVADEATAAAEDEEAEEDVLVASRDFHLHELIEDELLMEIPVTPRHEVCPEPARLSAADPDFEAAEAERPNPFAVLGTLRSDKSK